MMKANYTISAILVAALSCFACSSSNDDPTPTPIPTPIPTPEPTPDPTPDPTPTPVADTCLVSVDTIKIDAAAQRVDFTISSNISYSVSTAESWLTIEDGRSVSDSVVYVSVAANVSTDSREGLISILFSDSTSTTLSVKIIQDGALKPADPADVDSLSGTISNMTGVEIELGEAPVKTIGTLIYQKSLSASAGYSQGNYVVSKTDVCRILGITEADFDARAEASITVIPLNADLTEGRHTCSGDYGAWYGANGTADWGLSTSYCYFQGSAGDILTFECGTYPATAAKSCECILQYKDSENRKACNVVISVTITA